MHGQGLSSRLTRTIRCSTGRPRPAIRFRQGCDRCRRRFPPGKSVSRMIRIPAFGKGSRRRCSAKGSSLTSVVVMQTPGEAEADRRNQTSSAINLRNQCSSSS